MLRELLAAVTLWLRIDTTQQPGVDLPVKQELRPIEWGDLNFIHTTDTHGWLAGHILEPNFSGDWGDVISFVERIREESEERGVDLIVIDTGDRHDGNGLSDASTPDSILSLPIFRELDYDIVTIGNHELYRGQASLQEYHDMLAHYRERYIVSNVEVSVGRTWLPLGHKYRVWETPQLGFKILALCFLFDFDGNDREVTKVTPVAEELMEPWFKHVQEAILPEIDHVIVAGHIPARNAPEFTEILSAIRAVRPEIPVSMFGGHSHVRDSVVYDDNAFALQSGRYMETLGWASYNVSSGQFTRRYLDTNPRSFAAHTGVSVNDLTTEHGAKVSSQIAAAREFLNLDERRAWAPQTWYTDRAPYPSKDSVFTLLDTHVLPLLESPPELEGEARRIILNTGGIRFDLFEGAYTKDSGYIVSPFTNEWFYISGVPRTVADDVLRIINNEDRVLAFHKRSNSESSGADILPGYATDDDFGSSGDDTIHQPWQFYSIPNAIMSKTGSADAERVVIVFHDFMALFIEKALQELGYSDLYNPVLHGGKRVIDLIPQYLNSI